MGIEAFKKGLEILKRDNRVAEIEATRLNLEKSKDEERLKIFNELFGKKK